MCNGERGGAGGGREGKNKKATRKRGELDQKDGAEDKRKDGRWRRGGKRRSGN